MSVFQQFFYLVKNFLFPASCAFCDCSLTAQEGRCGICEKCLAGIKPAASSKCNMCGKPLVSEIETCLSCRNSEEKPYDRLWVIFPYTGKYQKLLTAYKFRKILPIANIFTEQILQTISANPELENAVIVPVPPRPGKIKHNGWDQVDYLVKRLNMVGKGSIKISKCLKRKKSKVQKHLDRKDRLENLKGRIFPCAPVPQTALIIDDVKTTGSTMEVCSAILKENGAKKVYGLCLFYD